MTVHVLSHHYDTPDFEGTDIIGVYKNIDDARADMSAEVESIREQFPSDIWQDDMTWESDDAVCLGFMRRGSAFPTSYTWEISESKVQ